jgi:hypothetical protein
MKEINLANVCTDVHGCGTRCIEVLIASLLPGRAQERELSHHPPPEVPICGPGRGVLVNSGSCGVASAPAAARGPACVSGVAWLVPTSVGAAEAPEGYHVWPVGGY